MEKDFLSALKKHIDSGVIEPELQKITKAQIHNFGENMKGINEFIGAIQTLNVNLTKIKNLSEKIEWINELLRQEENANTIAMLNMQKNAHIANIRYVIEGATFLGVRLFNADLSCAVEGSVFSMQTGNPLESGDMLIYCNEKLGEIEILVRQLNEKLNGDKDESLESAESANADEILRKNPFAGMA